MVPVYRIQIQSFLKHKDHRRINSWLKDLTEKEYIKRIWSNGYYERTLPAVYYLAPNSLAYLEIRYIVTRTYFKKIEIEAKAGPAEHYISDALFLGEISLSFLDINKAAICTIITKTELVDPYSEYGFLAETKIKPDLILAMRASTKNMTKYYFVEIIDRYASTILIRSKIKRYFDFYYSEIWEDNVSGKFPALLFVCPSLYLLIYAKRYARRIRSEEYEDSKIKFQFALLENVKLSGLGGEIWENIN
ncbi:MAG: hypothetical protein WCO23_01235 [bacterium]